MNIYTENHSSFPKVDERLLLKKALDKFDKGTLSWEEKEEEIKRTKCQVVQAQISAGLDVVTDGMVRWQDEISYLMLKFYGVESGGLSRWFDTNFYYRVPLIKETVCSKPYTLNSTLLLNDSVEFLEIDREITKPVKKKLILTGPYTLAKMSINKSHKNFQLLVQDLLIFIKKEVEDLISEGYIVQINEPAITKYPEDKDFFLLVMRLLFSNIRKENIILSTYFGGVEFMLKELIQDVNCGGIGLDLVEGTNQIEVLKDLQIDKDLHLGIMNARTTKLEDYEYYTKWLSLFDKIGFEKDIYVGPNNGLEFLPWDRAESKLKNMVECVNRYKGGR